MHNIYMALLLDQPIGRPSFNSRWSHTKDTKMVLDAALLYTQHYKVRIKREVEQSRERCSTLPYTFV